ncbi:hypothetical protein [Polaromonas sp.]|uniref:hypothetical protein n=1 Tax=Polaromonas sp. TaxID=1869339 RepID=UPI0035618653
MLKYSFSIKLLALTLGIAAGSTVYALTLYEATEIEKKAIKFAIDKDYKSAFRIVREMIEKAEASGEAGTARFGYRILQGRNLIANEALADITTPKIARVVCEKGFDEGMAQMETTLNSKLAGAADRSVYSQKAAVLKAIMEKYGAQKVGACIALSSDTTVEEQAIAALKAEEERAIAVLKAEEQRTLKFKEAEEEAEQKRLIAERAKAAPGVLRNNWSTELFCENYGEFLRGTTPSALAGLKTADTLFRAEAIRRGLSFDRKLVMEQKIRIGMSECGVYAAWGTPSDVNRTVGSWGVHKQFVYGSSGSSRNYIYIQNGRVSSFQD